MRRPYRNTIRNISVGLLLIGTAVFIGCECHHGYGCAPGQDCQNFKCVDTLVNAPATTAVIPTTRPQPTGPGNNP